jgi:predicted small secreted protein
LTAGFRAAKSTAEVFGEFSMRKLIVLTAAAAALLVASCNTIAGAGKDVAAAGKAVTSTAEDVRK